MSELKYKGSLHPRGEKLWKELPFFIGNISIDGISYVVKGTPKATFIGDTFVKLTITKKYTPKSMRKGE